MLRKGLVQSERAVKLWSSRQKPWSESMQLEEWMGPGYKKHGWDWGQEEKGTTEDEMAGWHH